MASRKVVLVMCDGLGDRAARAYLDHLEALVAERRATRMRSEAAMPTFSRPNYETLHTGVAPDVHGILTNFTVQRSGRANTFSLASAAGKITAAAAYSWISELYHRAPFSPDTDHHLSAGENDLHHGVFYTEDTHPDPTVFEWAAWLTRDVVPDYLLVHPMGCDLAGHLYGGASIEYADAARGQDELLASAIPMWLEAGYTVIVTADHGHLPGGGHGGPEPEVVEVPLYLIAPDRPGRGDTGRVVSHAQVAPTVWRLLGLDGPSDAATPISL